MTHLEDYSAPIAAQAKSREAMARRFSRNVFTGAMPTLATGVLGLLAAVSPPKAVAQEANPMSQPAAADAAPQAANKITEQNGIYIYRVKVVQRNLDCVNYLHRSGSTTIGFEGTPLLAGAKGEAKVTSERGGITIDAKFEGLTPANGFGNEY